MLEPPPDLTADMIAQELKRHWDIDATDVRYAPVGYGSHNWTAVDATGAEWFVKSNADEESEFRKATHRSALALHRAGLEFVHAALPDRTGDPRPLADSGWDLAVFPFIRGRNPDPESMDERCLLAETVGRLHASDLIPEHAVRWGPGWRQDELRHLLAHQLGEPWTHGPYGERARSLIRSDVDGVQRLLAHSDQLVAAVLQDGEPWVMTHGEPGSGNAMLDTDGRMHLIDCDVMMHAPRERDLWLLLYGDHLAQAVDSPELLAAYQRTAGPIRPRPPALELFRAERHLGEISGDLSTLSGPHGDDANVRFDWDALQRYLPVAKNWPGLA